MMEELAAAAESIVNAAPASLAAVNPVCINTLSCDIRVQQRLQ
jgi:hypothetical protein